MPKTKHIEAKSKALNNFVKKLQKDKEERRNNLAQKVKALKSVS